jgi:NAD-dependent DNA ligase
LDNNEQEAVQKPTEQEIEEEKIKSNKSTGENGVLAGTLRKIPRRKIKMKDECTVTRIVSNRLSLFHDTLVGEYHGRFRKDRSPPDQICTLKMLQKQSYEENLSLHILFVDQ